VPLSLPPSSPIIICAYGIAITLWSTLFMELWKRKNAALKLSWGIMDVEAREEARPQFVG
jgi:hypothetical protein